VSVDKILNKSKTYQMKATEQCFPVALLFCADKDPTMQLPLSPPQSLLLLVKNCERENGGAVNGSAANESRRDLEVSVEEKAITVKISQSVDEILECSIQMKKKLLGDTLITGLSRAADCLRYFSTWFLLFDFVYHLTIYYMQHADD